MDGYIPEDLIDRIRGSQDIVEVISRHLSLKKSGQNYVGLCPFHSEKTPSFTVSTSKQLFHCFGCGTGGNVITFLMKFENRPFVDTVKKLADDAGISIADSDSSNNTGRDKKKKGIYEVNKLAAEYYHNTLIKTKEGEPARAYLSERGLSSETIERFHIGYSLSSWDKVYEYLSKSGIEPEVLVESGIIIPKGKGSGYYDRFRGRIMFPIYDTQKTIVGFGGRVLDDTTPKYVNSPETPVFSKRHLLYGLYLAHNYIRESGCAIIVEGYMDVIVAHQSGIQNVVGTLGTALTVNHLRSLSRFTKEVILTFDSDTAGINAARRSVDLFLNNEINAKVLLLPAGEDPDSYIRKYGKVSFVELFKGAKGIIEFELDRIIENWSNLNQRDSIDARVRVAEECLTLIRKINNRIEQDYYLKRVAKEIGISEDVVMSEMVRKNRGIGNSRVVQEGDSAKEAARTKNKPGVEEIVLSLILKDFNLRKIAFGILTEEDFDDPRFREAGRYLLNTEKELHDIINDLTCDGAVKDIISRLAVNDLYVDSPEKTLIDCARVLQRNRLEKELRRIEKEIGVAERNGIIDSLKSLLLEKQQILQKRRFLYENN